jgi:hypothetical protein
MLRDTLDRALNLRSRRIAVIGIHFEAVGDDRRG